MTQTVQIRSRVGKDGVLTLRVPLGTEGADADVLVTIQPFGEPLSPPTPGPLDWHQFVDETYGSCAGLGLERHQQGVFEEREAME